MKMQFPSLVFLFSFLALWLSMKVGLVLRKRLQPPDKEWREDFTVLLGSTLGLLSLIIGFSFSMAVSRYDLRKTREAEEANAIGTEFLRVEMLAASDTERIQGLLRKYTDQRIASYKARFPSRVEEIDRDNERVQAELWSALQNSLHDRPTAVIALTVAGMNDVLNSQGYTQAAWRNRIPVAAWMLMEVIALFASLLIGLGLRKSITLISLALPFVIALAFFLIADLDSPRGGLIRMSPQDLVSLANSLKPH